MKKFLTLALLTLGSLSAAETTSKIGFIDFERCSTDSKVGKEEYSAFNALQNKAMADMQAMDKERQELAEKAKDQDYLDGLSPEAQNELNQKIQNQQMKMQMAGESYQNTLRQMYEAMEQKITSSVTTASKKIAEEKNLDFVFPSKLCIVSRDQMNVTSEVIKKMDELFDTEQKSSSQKEETASQK